MYKCMAISFIYWAFVWESIETKHKFHHLYISLQSHQLLTAERPWRRLPHSWTLPTYMHKPIGFDLIYGSFIWKYNQIKQKFHHLKLSLQSQQLLTTERPWRRLPHSWTSPTYMHKPIGFDLIYGSFIWKSNQIKQKFHHLKVSLQYQPLPTAERPWRRLPHSWALPTYMHKRIGIGLIYGAFIWKSG